MEVGNEVGPYKIIERIGRGGMADVWSARDRRLNRTVAIKTIARNLTVDQDPVKLFEREAKTIAALEHPHILPIYEFGEFQGQLYIVMRYVSGGSLDVLLDEGGLALDEVLRLARPIAQALDYAHANKVIHLDLKPSNILLDSYRSPYLADFGLATVLGPEGRAANPGSGTLLYMAPEQLTSSDLDMRADVYAYCILLFHMMTGQLPFDAPMPMAIKQLQTSGLAEMPDVTGLVPDVPAMVTDILRHGTVFDVSTRTGSIMAVFEKFEAALLGVRPTQTVPRRSSSPEMRTTRLHQLPPKQPDQPPAKPVPDMTTDLDVDMLQTAPFSSEPYDSRIDASQTADVKETPYSVLDSRLNPPQNRPQTSKPSSKPIPASADDQTINFASSPISEELVLAGIIASPDTSLGGEPSAGDLPAGIDLAARAEAILIYAQARRAWAGGQGKFLIGFTPFMLMNDFYLNAETYRLETDEAGLQMLLRGALEYDYEIDHWWERLNDESRRWVALHALRSQNAPAQIRALERLCALPDADPPQIPKALAALIQNETNRDVRREAIHTLEMRGRVAPAAPANPLLNRLDDPEPVRGTWWKETAFSPEIDGALAHAATTPGDVITAEMAARTVARVRSAFATQAICSRNTAQSRRALALIRDEAPLLPKTIPSDERFKAWLTNTARRVLANSPSAINRFLWAVMVGWIGMAVFIWWVTPVPDFLDAQRLGLVISVGLTFGVFFGLQVLIASELPSRLRRFWHWWGRGIASLILGLLVATFSWAAFTWMYLNYPPESNILAVGIGTAVALAIPVMFRLPVLINIALLTAGLFIPIYDAYVNYRPPILYVQSDQNAAVIFLVVLGMVSAGAYAPMLIRAARKLIKQVRK
ncbi:MAG: protein kinase [Anaerolineae bacterium]